MTQATGVKQLDDLLGGGFADRSTAIVHGPTFTGKDVLASKFALEGVRDGTPAVIVLTDDGAAEVSGRLEQIDPKVPTYEEEGLIWYLDAYSESIGAGEGHPNTRYVESVVNLNAFTRAMNEIQRQLLEDHEQHRMVFDSLTTLVVNTNAQTAFRFLQIFLGRTRQAGGTSLLLLEGGIHEDSEVRLIEHLTDGVMETRREGDKTEIRVEGFNLNKPPGWVEYEFTEAEFEIVGSFGVGRVT